MKGETTVLKLGGSVITDKAEPETIDEASLDRVADAIGASLGTDASAADGVCAIDGGAESVLVHGAGSFGHYHADERGVSTTIGTHDAAGVLAIHDAVERLNDHVLDRLHDRGVPALPIHPLSAAARDAEGALELSTTAERLLAEGFVPVLHGDVIAQEGKGATIVSGDELVVELASRLDAERAGLCSTVPGVLDAEGKVVERIGSIEAASKHLRKSETTDVTGGMEGKVRALLELDVPASVFGLDGLADFLAGGSPGTVVDRSPG